MQSAPCTAPIRCLAFLREGWHQSQGDQLSTINKCQISSEVAICTDATSMVTSENKEGTLCFASTSFGYRGHRQGFQGSLTAGYMQGLAGVFGETVWSDLQCSIKSLNAGVCPVFNLWHCACAATPCLLQLVGQLSVLLLDSKYGHHSRRRMHLLLAGMPCV